MVSISISSIYAIKTLSGFFVKTTIDCWSKWQQLFQMARIVHERENSCGCHVAPLILVFLNNCLNLNPSVTALKPPCWVLTAQESHGHLVVIIAYG